MKKPVKPKTLTVNKLIIALVTILAAVELLVSHRLATTGEAVRELDLQAEKLSQENQLLRESIASQGSLLDLATRATEIGLTRTNQIVSYTSEVPVALRP